MLTVAVVGLPFFVALQRWYGDMPERSRTPLVSSFRDLGRRDTDEADLGLREPDCEEEAVFWDPDFGRALCGILRKD